MHTSDFVTGAVQDGGEELMGDRWCPPILQGTQLLPSCPKKKMILHLLSYTLLLLLLLFMFMLLFEIKKSLHIHNETQGLDCRGGIFEHALVSAVFLFSTMDLVINCWITNRYHPLWFVHMCMCDDYGVSYMFLDGEPISIIWIGER